MLAALSSDLLLFPLPRPVPHCVEVEVSMAFVVVVVSLVVRLSALSHQSVCGARGGIIRSEITANRQQESLKKFFDMG